MCEDKIMYKYQIDFKQSNRLVRMDEHNSSKFNQMQLVQKVVSSHNRPQVKFSFCQIGVFFLILTWGVMLSVANNGGVTLDHVKTKEKERYRQLTCPNNNKFFHQKNEIH